MTQKRWPVIKFSNDLFNNIDTKSQNVVLSPLIVYAILNLANSGARNKTSDELNEALHRYPESSTFNDDDLIRNYPDIDRSISTIVRNWMNNQEYDLHLANRVLITDTYEIIDQFRRDVMECSNTQVEQVNFATNSAEILHETNSWVSEITRGKINKILDSVRADTLFIILSAVYFRGEWKSAFKPEQTVPATFYNFGRDATTVPMMHQKEVYCECYSFKIGNEIIEMVDLPYKGNICFTIILPKSMTFLIDIIKFDFEAIETKKLVSRTVDVSMPKFQFETKLQLNEALNKMGAHTPFTGAADFSGISKSGGLHISKILHRAVIEVNEEGTEAAAASAIVCDGMCDTKQFNVDHPFIFLIRDKNTGIVVFMGQVNHFEAFQ